jgi:uncharacterized coiled-coil protein SlyX
VDPTAEEIQDWKEQVRLNMLVHEYAQDKLKGPILATDRDTDDRLNDTVKKHYVRLAKESEKLSKLFSRLLQGRKVVLLERQKTSPPRAAVMVARRTLASRPSDPVAGDVVEHPGGYLMTKR